MTEIIRLILILLFLIAGMVMIGISIFGVFRFHFALNRMHCASIVDTLGFLCVLIALAIANGINMALFKYVLLLVMLWFGSPIASHLVAQFEVMTDDELLQHLEIVDNTGDSNGRREEVQK